MKYSIGNTVNNIVKTRYGARWALEVKCFKNLFNIFPFRLLLVILCALCGHSIIFLHFRSPQLLNFPSCTLTYFPLMSTPVSFVQWITHIFPNFAPLKFHALFFPFLGLSSDLTGKMKQHIQPIWLPWSPVDLSSIGKQKVCLKKKNPCLRSFFLKQLSDENTPYVNPFCRCSLPSI